MSNSLHKSNIKKSKFAQGGLFMTIPPQRKRKKTIKLIETENMKKEKEEIIKQNELRAKISELDNRIKLELTQYNKVISSKKEELQDKEKKIKQINEKNENLKKALEKLEKEIELKYCKNKTEEKISNNKIEIKKEDPREIKLKENKNLIENTRKIMEKYQKDIDTLENAIYEDEKIKEINNLKFEIKAVKQKINILEKEKNYLLIINEEHNKCIVSQDKIKKDIDYYNRELNKIKSENNLKLKEKLDKSRNDMISIDKNKHELREMFTPTELETKKENKIKKSINDFWILNKQKVLKYSLSDNDIDMNNIKTKDKNLKNLKTEIIEKKFNINNINRINKQQLYKKKKNYSENLNNLNLDIRSQEEIPPFLPLFNYPTKNILSKILPKNELEKYEKRYEYADIEKKYLLRQLSLENKTILREQKKMKNQVIKTDEKFKLDEAKNDKLNSQFESKNREYEKLRNIILNMKKDLEDKKNKIKIMNEENIIMTKKYQSIRDKYMDNDKKENEEGEEDEEEND